MQRLTVRGTLSRDDSENRDYSDRVPRKAVAAVAVADHLDAHAYGSELLSGFRDVNAHKLPSGRCCCGAVYEPSRYGRTVQ
jgi:hypothetical protein